MLHVHMACILWGLLLIPLFHGFHVSCVYPKDKKCASADTCRVPVDTCLVSADTSPVSTHPLLVMLRTISNSDLKTASLVRLFANTQSPSPRHDPCSVLCIGGRTPSVSSGTRPR